MIYFPIFCCMVLIIFYLLANFLACVWFHGSNRLDRLLQSTSSSDSWSIPAGSCRWSAWLHVYTARYPDFISYSPTPHVSSFIPSFLHSFIPSFHVIDTTTWYIWCSHWHLHLLPSSLMCSSTVCCCFRSSLSNLNFIWLLSSSYIPFSSIWLSNTTTLLLTAVYSHFDASLSLIFLFLDFHTLLTTSLLCYRFTCFELWNLQGVRAVHSAAAWCLCGAFWSAFSFLICFLFFLAVLNHTDALVPSFSLFLCGLSLGTSKSNLSVLQTQFRK